MSVLSALAGAMIAPPDGAAGPATLEAIVRAASAGGWRTVEVVLAGDVLRGRLGKARDPKLRGAVAGVLDLFGSRAVLPDALAALRSARSTGGLDGPLDLDAAVKGARMPGVADATAARVLAALAEHPDLAAALDAELVALLVDAVRAVFRQLAGPDLARWVVAPTGNTPRDQALTAFAALIVAPASVDELELLIAMPLHLDENVQFTVYRPRTIDPARWHPMLAFAHLAERRPDDADVDPIAEVKRQADAILGDRAKHYQPVTQDSGAAIPVDGELTFVPELPGIEINPPRRSFLWLEAVHREEFRIRAGAELHGKTVRGRMTVFLGHIAIAEVGLSVRVDAAALETTAREPAHARAYRKIFASYSHRDIEIVNQFETYARALGDEYLRDWIHLRTGEVWNDRLCQLIESADAFQLFWSTNAMSSAFVRHEYEHALSLNRPSFVRPTYWEDPMPTAPGLPPEALLRLHFQRIGGGTPLARLTEVSSARAAASPARRTMDVEPELAKADALFDVDAAVEEQRDPTPAAPFEPASPIPSPKLDALSTRARSPIVAARAAPTPSPPEPDISASPPSQLAASGPGRLDLPKSTAPRRELLIILVVAVVAAIVALLTR